MKKWKFIRIMTIIILILFFIYIICDAIICINMKYPHPMLGIDAYNWLDQFKVDLFFLIIMWLIPLVIDIALLIISTVKINKFIIRH